MLHCLVPDSRSLDATGAGALSGVRTAVKDCFGIAGHRSSFGHARWRETHAEARDDAEAVARLRRHGATIVGLTKMDQLAYSIVGNAGEGEPPVNTHDPACFCGGSSSGSASAVAGGLAELGVGTDTGGSIRVPAAACGLFGLRPTHGRVSVQGVIPLARSLDVVGFLAKDPLLLARALAATTSLAAAPGPLRRVLHPVGLGEDRDGASTSNLSDRVARILGAPVERVDGTELVNPEVGDLMARIQGREIWAAHSVWISQHMNVLTEDVQTRLRRCESLSADAPAIIKADLEARERYGQMVRTLVGTDGVLVMPVLPRRGPRRDWDDTELMTFRRECFQLTAPSSLAGVPQMVLTGEPEGGDVVLSLAGPRESDEALLSLASSTVRPSDSRRDRTMT
jgi:amidase